MIDAIIKYWKFGLVISAAVGGFIATYAVPSTGWFIAFLLDVRQVEANITGHETRIVRLEEVVIRTDERYTNILNQLKEINEREQRDRQERLSLKR